MFTAVVENFQVMLLCQETGNVVPPNDLYAALGFGFLWIPTYSFAERLFTEGVPAEDVEMYKNPTEARRRRGRLPLTITMEDVETLPGDLCRSLGGVMIRAGEELPMLFLSPGRVSITFPPAEQGQENQAVTVILEHLPRDRKVTIDVLVGDGWYYQLTPQELIAVLRDRSWGDHKPQKYMPNA